MLFSPGIFFILLGLVTVLAPRLILGVVAALFIFIGFAVLVVAYKFYQLRKQADKMFKNFGSAQVYSFELGKKEYSVNDDDDDVVIYH